MKLLNLLLPIIILGIATSSCVMTSQTASFNFSRNAGMEPEGDYITFKDGNKIKGKISTYRVVIGRGLFNKGKYTVTMDDKVYDTKSIVCFQKDSAAFAKIGKSEMFTERKMFGKITVYTRHIDETGVDSRGRPYHDIYDMYWLQKGANGEIKNYSIKTLELMVSDNPTALDLVQEYKKAKKKQKMDADLVAAIEIYKRV